MFTESSLDRRNSDERELIRSIRLSPIASILTNPRAYDNPIIAANRQFEQLTGYSESELVGRNCRILAGPETERAQSAALGRAVNSASPVVIEMVNYRKDGTKFRNAVMIAPLFDDEGKLAYFVGSQMEVAAGQSDGLRRSAAARIDQLTKQQQAVLRLMARGMRNRQIGDQLGLTEKTIKMHRGALVKRLGLSSAAEAMRLAIEAGF
jgi:PAS domain S-box-containing protein